MATPEINHRDLALIGERGRPFSDPGWVYELKYDGFRVLALAGAEPRLVSRNGHDLGAPFPEVIHALGDMHDLVIDGELTILDENGKPQFERLRRRAVMSSPRSIASASKGEPAVVLAFDLLVDGERDIRGLPLLKRKAILKRALKGTNRVLFLDHVAEHGERLFAAVDGLGLEGIVAKRADAPYRRGRSSDWLKIKTPHGREVDAERR